MPGIFAIITNLTKYSVNVWIMLWFFACPLTGYSINVSFMLEMHILRIWEGFLGGSVLSLINYALWLKKNLFLWNLQLVRTSPQRKNWHQEQVQHVSLLFLVHFCASIFLTTYDYENQATVKLKWFKYQTKQRNLNLHFDHVLNVTVLAYKYYTVIMNNTWCHNNI